jgi:ParB family chromosome partitioning protein
MRPGGQVFPEEREDRIEGNPIGDSTMAEFRSVDPRTLTANPNNPRRTPVPNALDEQLLVSLKAIGIIQAPVVTEKDGELIINAGHRRVRGAIEAGFATVDVIVSASDETQAPMRSLSENLIRASMTSVDIWRGIEALEAQGWNEQAIADALNLPPRTVPPAQAAGPSASPMLDVMGGRQHAERRPAARHRSRDPRPARSRRRSGRSTSPRRGRVWSGAKSSALSKRRIPFAAGRFDEDLARAYSVV